MNVATLVDRAARRHGSRLALDGPDGTRTFSEVGARAAQLANALLGAGLRPGDRVLDLQSNRCTYVESDFGIAAAGLCRVALNSRLTPSDWELISADCGARALIYDSRFADDVSGLVDSMDYSLVIGGNGPSRQWETDLDAHSTGFPRVDIRHDDLVSLNYSSGTTGRPKGAQRTHRNRFASLVNITSDILKGPPAGDDAWCHAGPMTHASGLFVLPHFVLGAKQVIMPTWDPEGLIEAVHSRGVTGVTLVPTMITRLFPFVELHTLASLRRLAYAGAPMPAAQILQALESVTPHLIQFYGLVEAMPPVTVLDASSHLAGMAESEHLLTSAGQACLGVEVCILDPEGGAPVAPGEVGEVATRGDHVMRGYFVKDVSASDDSSAKVLTGEWLRTGDLGSLDADGYLYLVDRMNDMIISGGYNVIPREIEDVIAELAGVDEVAVFGVPDDDWGQRVVAYCRTTPDSGLTTAAISAHCGNRLASFKKPKDIRLVDSFPLSATGKVAKKLLRQEHERTHAANE